MCGDAVDAAGPDIRPLNWLLGGGATAAHRHCGLRAPIPGAADEHGRKCRRPRSAGAGATTDSTAGLQEAKRRRLGAPRYWAEDTECTAEGDALDTARPAVSYSCLIAIAILSDRGGQLAVGDIYSFLAGNFPYFKTAKPTWRNSVRHVLSIGKHFAKRCPGPPPGAAPPSPPPPAHAGKGAVWALRHAGLPSLLELLAAAADTFPAAICRHLRLEQLRRRAATMLQVGPSAPARAPPAQPSPSSKRPPVRARRRREPTVGAEPAPPAADHATEMAAMAAALQAEFGGASPAVRPAAAVSADAGGWETPPSSNGGASPLPPAPDPPGSRGSVASAPAPAVVRVPAKQELGAAAWALQPLDDAVLGGLLGGLEPAAAAMADLCQQWHSLGRELVVEGRAFGRRPPAEQRPAASPPLALVVAPDHVLPSVLLAM